MADPPESMDGSIGTNTGIDGAVVLLSGDITFPNRCLLAMAIRVSAIFCSLKKTIIDIKKSDSGC